MKYSANGGVSRLKTYAGAAMAVALFSGNGGVALAQEGQSTTSGEILVTAQKRNERLQDVPIAISVISPQLLETTNARNFSELQGVVPGVYFAGNSGGGRTYVTLRGATGLALNTGDEPVAIYVDDIYMARGVTVGMSDLLDVGSIEIVRGPQGTLQGRNATAGAILLRSADPTPELRARAWASYSDPQEFRAQAMVSGPIGGGLEGRVSAGYVNDDGWAYNPYQKHNIGGAESLQYRGVVTYDQGGAFTARVVADHARTTNQPAIFRYAATNFTAGTGALVPAGTATPNTPLPDATRKAIFEDDTISLNPGTRTTVRGDGVSGKMQYAFGAVDLVSVTGYRKAHVEGLNHSDGLDVDKMGFNHNDDASKQFSQEVRLQSAGISACRDSRRLLFLRGSGIHRRHLQPEALGRDEHGHALHRHDRHALLGGLRGRDIEADRPVLRDRRRSLHAGQEDAEIQHHRDQPRYVGRDHVAVLAANGRVDRYLLSRQGRI